MPRNRHADKLPFEKLLKIQMSTIPSDPTQIDREQPRHSWRKTIERLVFARTSLEAQLYPPLKKNVLFRVYEPRDLETCATIYRTNEAGRFPSGYEAKFVE